MPCEFEKLPQCNLQFQFSTAVSREASVFCLHLARQLLFSLAPPLSVSVLFLSLFLSPSLSVLSFFVYFFLSPSLPPSLALFSLSSLSPSLSSLSPSLSSVSLSLSLSLCLSLSLPFFVSLALSLPTSMCLSLSLALSLSLSFSLFVALSISLPLPLALCVSPFPFSLSLSLYLFIYLSDSLPPALSDPSLSSAFLTSSLHFLYNWFCNERPRETAAVTQSQALSSWCRSRVCQADLKPPLQNLQLRMIRYLQLQTGLP